MVVARGWPKQPGKKGPATGCPACAVPLFFFSVAMLSMIYFFCDLNLAMSRQQTLDNMGCMVNTVVITVLSRCCHFFVNWRKKTLWWKIRGGNIYSCANCMMVFVIFWCFCIAFCFAPVSVSFIWTIILSWPLTIVLDDFCKYIFPASNLFLDVFGVAKVACLRKSSVWSVVIVAGCVVVQWVCRAAEGQYDFTLTTFVASSGLAFCNSEILVLEFARVDVGKHVGDKVWDPVVCVFHES